MAIFSQGTTIFYYNFFVIIIVTTHYLILSIMQFVSQIYLPPRKRPTRICVFVKQKKLDFEKEINKLLQPQIKLLLPNKVKQPENLKFDKMNNEFFKLNVS